MSNLRWIERDGKMILQFRLYESVGNNFAKSSEWQDVPTHKEPKKVSVEDELLNYIYCHDTKTMAGAAIEFFNNHPEYRKQMGW